MWAGLKSIIGGLLLLVLVSFSCLVFGQDLVSVKEKAITLLAQQEERLLQVKKDISELRDQKKSLEMELKQTQENDKKHTDELKIKLTDLETQLIQRMEELQTLSSSIDQLEASLKASRSETDTWVFVSVAILTGGITGAAINGRDAQSSAFGSAVGAISAGVLTWAIREGGHAFGWW